MRSTVDRRSVFISGVDRLVDTNFRPPGLAEAPIYPTEAFQGFPRKRTGGALSLRSIVVLFR